MSDLLSKVLVSVATTLILAALSLLSRSVRQALFYRRVQYDLSAVRRSGDHPFGCRWDIHWEDYRLTMEVKDISDDKLSSVNFEKLGGRKQTFDTLHPSETFAELFNGDLYAKVNSIVRKRPSSGETEYTLRMVFRRRNRWL